MAVLICTALPRQSCMLGCVQQVHSSPEQDPLQLFRKPQHKLTPNYCYLIALCMDCFAHDMMSHSSR